MNHRKISALVAIMLLPFASYAHNTATVKVMDAKGAEVGILTLTQQDKGVLLQFDGHGLPPGEHGIHFHEKGSCIAPDFKSAGGHLNPGGKGHGFDEKGGHHAGDLHNLNVNADGTTHYKELNADVTLEHKKPNSLWTESGTSLVIHAKTDDYMSQPAGNAGDRIACGVIQSKD